MKVEEFVEQWARSLERGTGSVFIGAGLAVRAGYPTWRSLLRDIASDLGLDVDTEYDLAAVAQFSLNSSAGKRNKLTKLIVDHFPPKAEVPSPFRILARLPIRHVWTTNYDKLIETAWEQEGKRLDVKSENRDLGTEKPWSHAVLYKMHGTIDHPSDVVIAKDDYELFRRERPGFLHALAGDVITKQLLFLGFSFTDQNVSHLFASIREAFRENGPEHFAIVRRPKLDHGPGAKKRWKTERARHELWVRDLQRYGISCIEVDKYEEIDDILKLVELRISSKCVFVSGSFPADGPEAQRNSIERISRQVGQEIAKRKKKLVSGYGLTVGSAAVTGALDVILKEVAADLESHLLLRPFPQTVPLNVSKVDFHTRYREGMIQQCRVVIFISGIKIGSNGNQQVIAEGVLEEFHIAQKLERAIIPVGSTGGASAEIWKAMHKTGNFPPGLKRADFERLNDKNVGEVEIARVVGKVLDAVERQTSR